MPFNRPATPRLHSVVEVSALKGENAFELSDTYFITSIRGGTVSAYLITSDYSHDAEDYGTCAELSLPTGLWREIMPEDAPQ